MVFGLVALRCYNIGIEIVLAIKIARAEQATRPDWRNFI